MVVEGWSIGCMMVADGLSIDDGYRGIVKWLYNGCSGVVNWLYDC